MAGFHSNSYPDILCNHWKTKYTPSENSQDVDYLIFIEQYGKKPTYLSECVSMCHSEYAYLAINEFT